ncbi:MAG: hypothetical protein H7X95_06725, partial [Deltaproteobacteria bacterium]|nr:hypothetical protein [Deltaproteobacteria bacterium]
GGGGSTGGAGGTAVYSPCPPLPAACKILPFGDSITDGVGASGGGYRIELFRLALLDGKKITFVGTAAPNGPTTVDGVAFPRQHEGHSGYTIDNQPAMGTITARAGISPLVPTVMNATKPDIVTLMIGTNDIQHSLVTNAPERLARLIDSIIAADAHTLIVVAQIVPTTDATVNMAIQNYNAAIPALVRARAAAGKHVVLVDMYQVIAGDPGFRITGRTVPNPAIGPMNDWLHPNAAGYKLMGAAWYGALKSALR